MPWAKDTEIRLKNYTGAWALAKDADLLPDIYERPDEDTGSWFLRAIGKLGIADTYFGNTAGTSPAGPGRGRKGRPTYEQNRRPPRSALVVGPRSIGAVAA